MKNVLSQLPNKKRLRYKPTRDMESFNIVNTETHDETLKYCPIMKFIFMLVSMKQ